MPVKTGYSAMTYACACVGMRTLRGDAVNSNCKDCYACGEVEMVQRGDMLLPNCPTYLCPCIVGQFTAKDCQKVIIYSAQEAAMKTRETERQAKALDNLDELMAESIPQACDPQQSSRPTSFRLPPVTSPARRWMKITSTILSRSF